MQKKYELKKRITTLYKCSPMEVASANRSTRAFKQTLQIYDAGTFESLSTHFDKTVARISKLRRKRHMWAAGIKTIIIKNGMVLINLAECSSTEKESKKKNKYCTFIICVNNAAGKAPLHIYNQLKA